MPSYTDPHTLAAFKKTLQSIENGHAIFDELLRRLTNVSDSSDYSKHVEAAIRNYSAESRIDLSKLFLLTRFVLSGCTVGGPFSATIDLLGQAAVQDRLHHFKTRCARA